MSYNAEISRLNPTLIVILLDQSRSMGERFGSGETTRSKAQGVSDALNRLLQELAIKASKSEGIRDYFYIYTLGYGHPVESLIPNARIDSPMPISKIADSPARIETRQKIMPNGEQVSIKFPVWIDPKNYGWTHMCEGLNRASSIVKSWKESYPNSFPPIIFNLTDGGATDGDPREPAASIRSIIFEDGEPLIINLHLSSRSSQSIRFPATSDGINDKHAKTLFDMSSELPQFALNQLTAMGESIKIGSRAFIFNADLASVITMLNVGTSPQQAFNNR